MSKNSVQEYLNTYAGQQLIKKHSLTETGLWRIRGEDPNCDLGGHHYQPELGIVEGKLEDVIAYAITIKSFYSWGGGGDIVKVPTPPKITAGANAERIRLEQHAEELRQQLAAVEQQIKKI